MGTTVCSKCKCVHKNDLKPDANAGKERCSTFCMQVRPRTALRTCCCRIIGGSQLKTHACCEQRSLPPKPVTPSGSRRLVAGGGVTQRLFLNLSVTLTRSRRCCNWGRCYHAWRNILLEFLLHRILPSLQEIGSKSIPVATLAHLSLPVFESAAFPH